MFRKQIVIDGRAHLLGRLASVVAKQLLKGQNIVVVRCEEIDISGHIYRNRLKYQRFLRLRMNTNPRRGPFHLRAPSKIFWRTIRGMLPHKTPRGQLALARLRTYDGMPSPFDRKKKMNVPMALRALKLKPDTPVTRLGDMASRVGWNQNDLIERLEAKRKIRSNVYYEKKKEAVKLMAKAREMANKTMDKNELAYLMSFNKA